MSVLQLFETCCHTRAWAGLEDPINLKVRPGGGPTEIDAYVADVEGGMATTPPLGGGASAPRDLPRFSSGVSVNGINTVANAPAAAVGTVAGPRFRVCFYVFFFLYTHIVAHVV